MASTDLGLIEMLGMGLGLGEWLKCGLVSRNQYSHFTGTAVFSVSLGVGVGLGLTIMRVHP